VEDPENPDPTEKLRGAENRRWMIRRGNAADWLAAGQAADTTIGLLNSFQIHTKHLLRIKDCLT
jgi:hypothetical protein